MIETFFAEYEVGAAHLRQAIQGLTPVQLRHRPADGSWSIQQIVLHMMDSELIVTDRAKRIIAEPEPQLIGFDERLYAANLLYDEQTVDDAVSIIEISRRQFARILRKLPPEAMDRCGFHNERGQATLRQVLLSLNSHFRHHLERIREKRTATGDAL
jgi:uncharacterized damage-inducible protein DinB